MSAEDEKAEFNAVTKKLAHEIKAIRAEHGYTNEEVVALLRYDADFIEKRYAKKD